jgi:hypothetical protein
MDGERIAVAVPRLDEQVETAGPGTDRPEGGEGDGRHNSQYAFSLDSLEDGHNSIMIGHHEL